MEASVCVVIPLYKEKPSAGELMSIRRACEVFAGRDIFYVKPQGMSIEAYPFQAAYEFPEYYFSSLQTYSELCCYNKFYSVFRDYEYMLICQPDCWVFEDRLDEFCALGYDYIGAPWPKMEGIPEDGVGNGGFCLRRVSRFVELTRQLCDCGSHPEDRFWCIDMHDYLNIAPISVAATFSLEHEPSRWFKAYGKVWPMGCHKPWRFEYRSFWKGKGVPGYED
jgi:hypothetical protein